ncbi:cadherin-23-like, partial [Ylistrum balloti]|uniref:cadherin-23-like n=1 Tax=Ylistrum balloti TaxID=509963 RepID=UPI002905E561
MGVGILQENDFEFVGISAKPNTRRRLVASSTPMAASAGMDSLGLLVTTLVIVSYVAAQNPCELTTGSSTASNPTIRLDFDEATATDLLNLDAFTAFSTIFGTLSPGVNQISLTIIDEATIKENEPNGTSHFQLVEQDLSSPINGETKGVFIRLFAPVDRDGADFRISDDVDVASFKLQCRNVLDTTTTITYNVLVTINDINDNTPEFEGLPYQTNVDELAVVGTTIFQDIFAIDKDAGNNRKIIYGLLPGVGSSKFSLDTNFLKIASPLDYESLGTNKFYLLEVTATVSFEYPGQIVNLVESSGQIINLVESSGQIVNFVEGMIRSDCKLGGIIRSDCKLGGNHQDSAPAGTQRTATATVTVNIMDADDLSPVFEYAGCTVFNNFCVFPQYTSSITSGTTSTLIINRKGDTTTPIDIRARDRDSLNYPISFSILDTYPPNLGSRFSLSEGPNSNGLYTTFISVNTPLNIGSEPNVVVFILAQESGQSGNNRTTEAVLELTVNPANVLAPDVTVPFTGYVDENVPLNTVVQNQAGTQLLRLIVADRDLADPSDGTYDYAVSGTSNFGVTADGYIVVTGDLNYEAVPFPKSFTFTVQVTETHTAVPLSTSVSVTVFVRDVNDLAPAFTGRGYADTVVAGDYSASPSSLIAVTATDGDTGDFGTVRYTIFSGDTSVFAIDNINGLLSVIGTAVKDEVYTVEVQASDSPNTPVGRLSTVTAVTITVTPSGTEAPVIPASTYTVTVSEGVNVASSIFTVPASDPEGQALTFSFISGNNPAHFAIDNTGKITNIVQLDRETRSSYTLGVVVTDQTLLTDTATVDITVTDINDFRPFFNQAQYTFQVAEEQVGATVGEVEAFDNDEGANGQLDYSISQVSTGSLFSISSNGIITTAQALDYESQTQHIILVLATDRGNPQRTGTASVTINVLDIQDNVPQFVERSYTVLMNENLPAGTSVINVQALDADTTDAITYKFSTGSFSPFTINPGSGLITLNTPLNFEVVPLYIFTVTTNEGETSLLPSVSTTVTVSVVDLNDADPILSVASADVTVDENIAVGTYTLFDVDATDADPANTENSRVTFSITGVNSNSPSNPNSGDNLFTINSDTGVISLAQPLTSDATRATVYNINVEGRDHGVPIRTGTTTLTLNVVRNNAPVFPAPLTRTVDSNAPFPNVLFTFAAIDNDAGAFGILTYSLIADGRVPNHFEVGSSNGAISLRSSLLTDDSDAYYLRVVAVDGGDLSATGTVTVSVNRNLFNPSFNGAGPFNFATSVLENAPLLQSVFQLAGSDADQQSPYNQITYSIVGDTLAQQYFLITETGQLQLKRSPADNQGISSFTVTVGLQDQGVPPRTATSNAVVTVNVLRNTLPPIFFNQTYTRSLNENVPSGTNVVTVIATDANTQPEFNTITYSLFDSSNLFSISSNGQITTAGDLETPTQDLYTLVVVASDNGSPAREATAYVYVTILRNFFNPVWSVTSFSDQILETQTPGTSLTGVNLLGGIEDRDTKAPGNTINFRMNTGTTPAKSQQYFQVSASGDISVKEDLRTDGDNLYLLYIDAYDLGSPSRESVQTATVSIAVTRNDAPTFTNPTFTQTVTASINQGSTVFTLTAQDPNIGVPEFNQLTFTLLGIDTALTYFELGSRTANTVNIVSRSSLLAVTEDTFKLLVRVQDNGSPSLSNQNIVTLTMLKNLNAPEFIVQNYNQTILETQTVGSNIGVQVRGRDADALPPHNVVKYEALGEAATLTYFAINSNDGQISVIRPLTLEENDRTYVMRVILRDSSLLSQQTGTVSITVRRNNFDPFFTNLPSVESVARTAQPGASLFTVLATDADSVTPFNSVQYAIVAGNTGNVFNINSNTGAVTLGQSLPSLTVATYVLSIMAYDQGVPSRVAYSSLTFNVDSNLETPRITKPTAGALYQDTVNIIETIQFESLVYDVVAVDTDNTSPYNTLTYSIVGTGKGPDYFSINPDNGEIRIKASLLQDSARDTTYTVLVSVQDGGSPPKVAVNTATITIIVDRNDFAPQWQNLPYNMIVPENIGVNNVLNSVQAQATDADTFYNVVRYEVIGFGSAPVYFQVNEVTGSISVRSALSGSSEEVFYVRVRAYDNGSPPKENTTTVTLSIERNLFAPTVDSPSITERIPATQALGVSVVDIPATDGDSQAPNNVIRYNLTASAAVLEFFDIDVVNGFIYVKKSLTLDTAETQQFTMSVSVYDMGTVSKTSPSSTAVIINVYRNRNAPFFSAPNYATTISEGRAVGDNILPIGFGDSDTD